jgi:hypothetical protein
VLSLENSPLGAPIKALGVVASLRLSVNLLGVSVADNNPIYAGEYICAPTLLKGILEI